MTNTLTNRRQETKLRRQFDRAFEDLSLLLTGYHKTYHFDVVTSYLRTYGLLIGKDSARGRLIIKLGVLI